MATTSCDRARSPDGETLPETAPTELARVQPEEVPTDAPRFVEQHGEASAWLRKGYREDGLYLRPGDPETLVLIRSDGEFAPVSMLEPSVNMRNRWRFDIPGTRMELSDPRLAGLISLPHEGFYRLTRELRFGENGRWVTDAIVELGYDRHGVPLVFIAQWSTDENALFFSEQGVRISREQLAWLEQLAWYEADDEKE